MKTTGNKLVSRERKYYVAFILQKLEKCILTLEQATKAQMGGVDV
jgi:hypothetical protein